MVRFIDDHTVLINDYSKEDIAFQLAFRMALQNAGLQYIEIPYCPDPYSLDSATGAYVNYLQMEGVIILPTFDIKEDNSVVKQFEKIFCGNIVKTINCNELAVDGGLLNCISWNIRKYSQ
jgi:agmatine deiminase